MGRWHYTLQTGAVEVMLRDKMQPVAGVIHIQFKKQVPPFAKLALDTRIIEVREKRLVFEQTFYRPKDQKVFAKANVEVAILRNGKTITLEKYRDWGSSAWKPSNINI